MKLLVLLLLTCSISHAATVNAASCSQSDVASAITAASAGDTVQVPAGSCSWTSLSITKAVHLKGAGIDVTTIAVSGSGATKQSAGVIRISDFTFTKTGGGNSSKALTFGGSWASAEPIIFHDNKVQISDTGFILIDVPGGVIIANNEFIGAWDDSFIQPKANSGQNSWSTADTLGDRDTDGKLNVYVEDNTFYGGTNQGIDCDDNTRCVYRYNYLLYSSFNTHGWATSPAGVRHFEVYNNHFDHQGSTAEIGNQNWSVWIRGATGFIYNNQFADIAGSHWGNKSELQFTIRGAEDARPQGSCGNVSYPVPHQLGQNHNGSSYFTDPIRWYSNTGTLAVAAGFNWGNPCGLTFSTFWQENRDYVIGTAKPGYVAYTYPHPLLSLGEPEPIPPTITTSCPLPGGQVGEAYSQTMTATGDPTITWDLSAGALPDGLTLASDGALTGTPTEDGTFNFTLRATNDTGNDTEACSVEIDPAEEPPPSSPATISGSSTFSGSGSIQ